MVIDLKSTSRRESFVGKPIDGQALKRLVNAGLTWLRTNQDIVNALNVFPVPDGDTGTNMVLTMQAAYDEIAISPEYNFGLMAHAVAHGALMGARGNSGVILSQIWRGFARTVGENEYLDGHSFVNGLVQARDTAYKGVVRPVEGTILTVIKDAARAGKVALDETEDPISILEKVVNAASESVENTPNLLDVLRDAGVVDAGGKGLFFILEGMLRYIDGLALDKSLSVIQPLSALVLDNTLETIEPGQDWEVILDFKAKQTLEIPSFFEELEKMGTSIQFGEGDGIYRLHIHVPEEHYYTPEDYIKSIGIVTKVAKENLVDQMENQARGSIDSSLTLRPIHPGDIGVIAVAPGIGIARIFASMGVAAIVEGGQTMNPSTEEIIRAFENLPTDKIIILPNNKNIFMAAKSASELTVKKVTVIPTRTVPQGFSAMMRLVPDGDYDQVVNEMNTALEDVQTGEITIATRSVEINGVETVEGEFIALLNGTLVACAKTLDQVCFDLLEKAQAGDYELITLYYGEDLSKQEASRVIDVIRDKYPDQELELYEGRQPHYFFIISIE